MTREELLKALTYIVSKCDNIINNKNYTADDFVQDTIEDIAEVCNMILDGKYGDILEPQPPLPSNLDEAAEEYAKNNYLAPDFMVENLAGEYDSEIDEYKFCTADAFKAGAKWQKEQGVKATASIGYYSQCGLSILTKPSIKKLGFKEGDEAEIILRKK